MSLQDDITPKNATTVNRNMKRKYTTTKPANQNDSSTSNHNTTSNVVRRSVQILNKRTSGLFSLVGGDVVFAYYSEAVNLEYKLRLFLDK